MSKDNKPVTNPNIVIREEFDDWGLLFDPDLDKILGINAVGAFVWKRLDGKHTIADILVELQENCEDVPAEAEEHINEFIQNLIENGLAHSET
jgi:SynChlorMet cassette protein ScmD